MQEASYLFEGFIHYYSVENRFQLARDPEFPYSLREAVHTFLAYFPYYEIVKVDL
jgi:hypothetical protein